MSDDLQQKIENAVDEPKNLGEMENADAVGTAGSADCGDMLRIWIKFRDEDGKKVIDKATFQTFGCETAIAVASLATQLIQGKTPEEAMAMDGEALSAPLGPLPPMRIHCAQLVEGALRLALSGETQPASDQANPSTAPTLLSQLSAGQSPERKVKIVLEK